MFNFDCLLNIYICRPVRLPSVATMIKRPKGSHSTSTPLEEPSKIIDVKEDMKPVVIPEQILQENQAANGVLCVPLEQLTL